MAGAALLAERFELGEIIGEGAWSVVHDGRDLATGRRVAIKFAAGPDWDHAARDRPGVSEGRDDVRRRFAREASALAVIASPHVVNRGAILHHAHDARAREVIEQAFAHAVAARFHEGIAWALELLGQTSRGRGELLQARAQLAAALRVHRRLGDRWRCASVLEALAATSIASERPARAVVYLGAADAIRAEIGAPVPACERAQLDYADARARDALGEAYAAGRERGRRTPLDQIIALAREVT